MERRGNAARPSFPLSESCNSAFISATNERARLLLPPPLSWSDPATPSPPLLSKQAPMRGVLWCVLGQSRLLLGCFSCISGVCFACFRAGIGLPGPLPLSPLLVSHGAASQVCLRWIDEHVRRPFGDGDGAEAAERIHSLPASLCCFVFDTVLFSIHTSSPHPHYDCPITTLTPPSHHTPHDRLRPAVVMP